MRLYKLEQMVREASEQPVSELKLHGGKNGKITVEYKGRNQNIDIDKLDWNNPVRKLLTNEELVESVLFAIKVLQSELDAQLVKQQFWADLAGEEPAPAEIEFRLTARISCYQVWQAGKYYGNIEWSYNKDLWHVVGKGIEFYAPPDKQKAAEQLIILHKEINKED